MVMNDTLAGVLSHINNCEIKGKRECLVKPVSNLIIKVLNILKDNKLGTIAKLSKINEEKLYKIDGIGGKAIKDNRRKLGKFGVILK